LRSAAISSITACENRFSYLSLKSFFKFNHHTKSRKIHDVIRSHPLWSDLFHLSN
jgi:hypothetical protein